MRRIDYEIGDVIGPHGCVYEHEIPPKSKARKAVFRCGYCSLTFEACISNIKNGHTRSCGCLQKKETGDRFRTHGMSNTNLYWQRWALINRCYNKNDPGYPGYGGRGIWVCEEWLNDPTSFFSFAMDLPHYGEPGRSIERINNDGNYEPGNVKWGTRHEQNTNQRVRSTNKSGYTGINFDKVKNRWISRIRVNGIRYFLGQFLDLRDAVEARNNYIRERNLTEYKIKEYHG